MNDYGTDERGEYGERNRWMEQARARVHTPGMGLMIYGIVSVFLAVMSLGIYVANPDLVVRRLYDLQQDMMKGQQGAQALPPYEEYRVQQKLQGTISSGVSLLCSVLIFLGGSKMKNLQGYGLALTGSILSMIPCTNSCCCIGTPLGIWALVVLLNSDVKLAFSRNTLAPDRDVPPDSRMD